MKAPLVAAGIFLLGLVLLAVGALIEPPRPQISQSGESLIALGLTFIVVGVGFFLAWANPTA
ncbi:MAG: hypothetical protein E6K15_01195 [Methanobacteriota archaeon]|nr:MAG: hypothetical protein E6K15_01195 [Euryarchaeota archaeon]